MNINDLSDDQTNFLLYTGDNGNVNIEVFLKDENIWLTQKVIGALFGKSKATISGHLKKIYAVSNPRRPSDQMRCYCLFIRK